MAAISSKFRHYASPLLRAFHLPNHGHFPNSSILTKPPPTPPPYIHQNPNFSHFPSVASSVVRHPYGEWRHDHASRLDQVHIPPTTHDSPLLQMWRDLQAEAKLCPTPHTLVEATPQAVAEKDFSVGSNTAEAFCDLEKAAAAPSSEACSSPAESEITRKRKVEDNIRMQGLRISSLKASTDDDFELSAAKEVTDDAPAAALLPLLAPSQIPSPTLGMGKKALLESGRWGMEDFLLKLEKRRGREAATLTEHHPISPVSFGDVDDLKKEIEEITRFMLKEMRRWGSEARRRDNNDDDDDDNGDDKDDYDPNNNNNDDDWF